MLWRLHKNISGRFDGTFGYTQPMLSCCHVIVRKNRGWFLGDILSQAIPTPSSSLLFSTLTYCMMVSLLRA